MLLLMIQTERDQLLQIDINVTRQQRPYAFVDALAIVDDLGQCRARQVPALRPSMHGSYRLVVRIEKNHPIWMKGYIACIASEHELLEEPSHMRQVPFRRTCVLHRLHCGVFGREPSTERYCRGANAQVARR